MITAQRSGEFEVVHIFSDGEDSGEDDFIDSYVPYPPNDLIVVDVGRIILPPHQLPDFIHKARLTGLEVEIEDVA